MDLRGMVARVKIRNRYLRLVEEKFKSLLLWRRKPLTATKAENLVLLEALCRVEYQEVDPVQPEQRLHVRSDRK